ncbi:hypothetical protein [Vibrio phage VCPH]|nr:hypothetical protein [Vibrio phage VCPH]
MPCRDYAFENTPSQRVENLGYENQRMKQELDRITGYLCKLSGEMIDLENEGVVVDMPVEIREWYKEHRKQDISNMVNLLAGVDLESMPKKDFDALDALLSKYQEE